MFSHVVIFWTDPANPKAADELLAGTNKYPNEFAQSSSVAHTLLFVKDESARQEGFKDALRAFELKPSQIPLVELLTAARYPEFKAQVEAMLKEFVEKFDQEGDRYTQTDGYNNKLVAAIIAANYLERTSNDPRLTESYRDKSDEYRKRQSEAMESSRW